MKNTLVKGLQLLELLAHSESPIGISDLAQKLSLAKSNIHRLLQALVALGYVRQISDTKRYCAFIRLWELGSAVLAQLDLKRVAQPYMSQLQVRTREAAHLSVLDGDDVVYVHKIDCDEPVRAYSEIGGRAPAHCVATGKALLAWQGESVLRSQCARLTRHAPRTLVSPDAFMREMGRIRLQRYALNRGEWREAVGGVAAPIRGAQARVVAAIGVSGPLSRLGMTRMRTLAPAVIEAAEAISEQLSPRSTPIRLW